MMMAWIESHQTLKDHPKLRKMKNILGWTVYETIGRLQCLWWWCLDYAEDGILTKYSPSEISEDMGVVPDMSSQLIQTMLDVKLLETSPVLHIHDWWKYAGPFLQVRYKKYPRKWRKIRSFYM